MAEYKAELRLMTGEINCTNFAIGGGLTINLIPFEDGSCRFFNHPAGFVLPLPGSAEAVAPSAGGA
jgi:hypothetical protein